MIRFLVLTLLLLLTVTSVSGAAANSPTQKTPEQVTHEFYRWYIHALNKNQDPLKQRQTLGKYVTARLIRQINRAIKANEYDVDYFLDAQDWDNDWEKNITVSDAKADGDKIVLSVLLDGTSIPKHKLNVTLRKENGVWKIDKVQGLEQ